MRCQVTIENNLLSPDQVGHDHRRREYADNGRGTPRAK
ncbi:hypothetical protein AVU87_gp16 [Mycobacterium phage Theia]|uniref:Uncharacterized protein n=1 Tax=Mycobacterium phage Theia TaxID=1718172 RepID=A0A0N9S901_9CAUD|nr:hypothetical protein AVU87_gp16 [Mycobacterium phage Theia]ALH46929.1 hypothetical protein SEA_THEIA_77 [Mycobacterium phage Theia]